MGHEGAAQASLHRLARTAESTLDLAFAGVDRVALLDYPAFSNVGDSAILLGEMEYFRSREIKVVHVSDRRTYDAHVLRRRLSDTAIALHGGGNFGDLWPAHQAFRERVLTDFPQARVIQLPQSVHFNSQAAAEASAKVCRAHRGFTLLTRDEVSVSAASSFTDDVHLCPDSAHLVQYPVASPPSQPALWLARTDIEAVVDGPPCAHTVDWLDDVWSPSIWLQARAKRLARQGRAPRLARRLMRASSLGAAQQRLDRGCRLLQRGNTVVTDRLHATIFSMHLGRRVIAVDNNYGKLSSYINTWLSDGPDLRLVDSWQAACQAELP